MLVPKHFGMLPISVTQIFPLTFVIFRGPGDIYCLGMFIAGTNKDVGILCLPIVYFYIEG